MTYTVAQLEILLRGYYRDPARQPCERTAQLARYLAGVMSPPEARGFRGHLAQCWECGADAEQWNELEARPSGGPPASRLSSHRQWRWSRASNWIGGGLAAAAALLLLVLFQRVDEASEQLRPMGAAQLQIGVQRGDEVFRLAAGQPLRAGDRCGFFYSSATPGYLLIVHLDEMAQMSVLFPAGGSTSAAIAVGSDVRLPDGAMLTPAGGCEWIVALFSQQPLALATLAAPLGAAVQQREGCHLGVLQLSGVDEQIVEVTP